MVVELTREEHVAIITLKRPEARNAVNGDVAEALEACLDDFESDDELWVAILTGEGQVFSASADLKAIASGDARRLSTAKGGFGGLVKRERTKPVIAAVNGPALIGWSGAVARLRHGHCGQRRKIWLARSQTFSGCCRGWLVPASARGGPVHGNGTHLDRGYH